MGGIAAAPLGGFLLARGLPPKFVFLCGVVLALVAAIATALLALRGRAGDELSTIPQAQ